MSPSPLATLSPDGNKAGEA